MNNKKNFWKWFFKDSNNFWKMLPIIGIGAALLAAGRTSAMELGPVGVVLTAACIGVKVHWNKVKNL